MTQGSIWGDITQYIFKENYSSERGVNSLYTPGIFNYVSGKYS